MLNSIKYLFIIFFFCIYILFYVFFKQISSVRLQTQLQSEERAKQYKVGTEKRNTIIENYIMELRKETEIFERMANSWCESRNENNEF